MANDVCEIVVESEKRITRKVDGVTEVYSLYKAPPVEYSLVRESRKSILQTIQLDELFSNLDNCVSLLDITYNAVNGMGMSSSVTELKDKFSDTLDDSLVVMSGFKAGTATSVKDFIASYEYLTDPIYKVGKKNGILMAVDKLSAVEQRAVKMEGEASSLADTFDKIETIAQTITKQIMNERDLDVKKKDEALAKLSVLQGKVKALKEVKDTLDEEITEYGEQYDKLSKQIEKSEERAFTLSIVSAVMGGLSSMFGGGNIPAAPTSNGQSSGGGSGDADVDKTKQQYEESEKKVQQLKEKVEACDKELGEIREKLKEEQDEDEKKKLSDRQDELTKEKKQAEDDLQVARGQSDIYKNALAGISGGLSKTSEELSKMADKMDEKNMSQYDRLDKIAQQKAKVQKERRDTILQLSEMTSEIENATTESRDLELCISALITAVGCMRIVKVYLSDIALFWKNVAKFCSGLVDCVKDLNENIGNFTEVEDYCEIFKRESFVNAFLLNIVSWVALNEVSTEYLEAFYKTRENYQELEKLGEVTPKEHWIRAKEKAKELNVKLEEEVKKCS